MTAHIYKSLYIYIYINLYIIYIYMVDSVSAQLISSLVFFFLFNLLTSSASPFEELVPVAHSGEISIDWVFLVELLLVVLV